MSVDFSMNLLLAMKWHLRYILMFYLQIQGEHAQQSQEQQLPKRTHSLLQQYNPRQSIINQQYPHHIYQQYWQHNKHIITEIIIAVTSNKGFISHFAFYISQSTYDLDINGFYQIDAFWPRIYWRKTGISAIVARMHSTAKRQKIVSNGILGMIIIESAVKNAAEPSINDDTFVTLPFSCICAPISIAITVPMILQGPPIQFPMRNMAAQQVHTVSPSANATRNMTTELKKRRGIMKVALRSKRSARKPTTVPPIRLPRSIMLAMQPFWSQREPPLLAKKMGSQKRRPQMQPLRQEQPIMQRGTLGRQITLIKLRGFLFSSGTTAVQVRSEPYSDGAFNGSSSSPSGLSLRKKKMRTPTEIPNSPVMKKFQTQENPEF